MKHRWIMILIIVFGLTACSSGGNSPKSNQDDESTINPSKTYEEFNLNLSSGPADLGRLNMSLTKLGAFQSVFNFTFNGEDDWVYQVETRYDGKLIEYNLEIIGVAESIDPGDVRLVNNSGINQMIGPGTDNLCVQFPDEMNTGVLFISPVDVINPDILIQDWEITKNQPFLEREADIHTTSQDYYYGWEDIDAELVIDTKTGAILRYTFDAVGSDPLYGNGAGLIHGEFIVEEIGPQKIHQVAGCEIPVPIPADARNIVILTGMYSFESDLGPVKLDQFFDRELLINGWGRQSAQVNDDAREGILIYFTSSQTLTIHIQAKDTEDFSEGFQVTLFLEDN
jgi:hypothetical protein